MCSPMRKPRFREFHRPACCGTVAHQHSEQSGSTLAVGCGNHILFLELFSLRHPDLDSGKKSRCSLWGDRTMIYPTWILIVKALHHIFGNLETQQQNSQTEPFGPGATSPALLLFTQGRHFSAYLLTALSKRRHLTRK